MADPITGLLSKRSFVAAGDRWIPRAAKDGVPLAVAYLEIQGYDDLVTLLSMGEIRALLVEIADRLRELFGAGGLVARFDSERFAVMAPQAELDPARIRAAFRRPVLAGVYPVPVRLGIGLADTTGELHDTDMLNLGARLALRYAAEQGQLTGFFTPDLHTRARRLRRIEDELPLAVERGEMSVVFQPKVCIRTGEISGVEALLRWRHPDLGAVSPGEFIPAAERTGRIGAVGRWVLDQVIADLARWAGEGIRIPVSVNVSPLQVMGAGATLIDPAALAEQVRAAGLTPDLIELEVTEGILADTVAVDRLNAFADRGFRIAVDDFGKDYSGLRLLAGLRASTLKIDRAFVGAMSVDRRQQAVVDTIIDLARRLDMDTVVEGVERADQLVAFARAGCSYAQGYFYFKPLTADALTTAIRSRAGGAAAA
jgi:EAL domain-containing protein (putative c-di-GMP-specific phosphodiesterase class I)